ncbi:MAG: hypothetical protein AMDU4_FER2C00316G0005 [Ferroplasma sp. Type II]|uniref:DUF929 family protein n=1 Tax=Ferroplasma sp. Type II TaxID=261388 RepID=UPI0003895870|nr:DUF929 family protein [Ferroplasma sp. Type II]EQB68333.1 MAG: hypothetical protein AMDU4_FER2C00316G0005 [Ferroplasma sp. Type II]
MSTKKNNIPVKKQGKNKPNYTGFFKTRNFLLTAIMAVIIVIIVVLAVLNPFFAAPAHITADKYIEVSQKDLLSNGSSAVFFLSWIGCPIGASDSWALYYGINSTTNISSHVELHTADPSDVFSSPTTGLSGLLFKGNFTFTASGHKFTFYPLYMYNETMSGTVANKSINGSLVSYGLSLINNTYPAKVAAMFNKYSSDITYKNHLTTTFLITGPHGTYIYNSYMYDIIPGGVLGSGSASPGNWSPNSPQYVMSHLGSSSHITKAASTFMGYLAKSQ